MTATVYARSRQAWRWAIPLFLLLFAWVLFWYRGTAEAIVTIWLRSETFAHCFVVPPLVIWLVWRQRDVLATRVPRPSTWALLLLAGAAFTWLLGDLVAVNALTQLAFVAMLVLLVPSLLGVDATRLIIFPLAFLFFAVPFGEFVMPQLMVWTADFTVLALRMSGIPVYREGLQFVIPSGNWSVVEACSGVRYLIASVTVGTLFAYLNYRSFKRRAIFVGVSILVPVVANWARAYMIVMLGHVSGNTIATGVDHLIYGWAFFGIVIMIMFAIGARWAEPDVDHSVSNDTPIVAGPANMPAVWFGTALVVAALVVLPIVARWAIDRSDRAAAVQLAAPQSFAAGWVASREQDWDWKPAFHNPSAEINLAYGSEQRVVGLYLGYYREQNYERKLVTSENVWVPTKDPRWVQVSSGSRNVDFAGKPSTVRTGELRASPVPGHLNEERLTVWQIYWVNGTLTASDTIAKAYGALYRLLGRGDDSAVIILYTPKGQAGEGDASLDSFLQANAAAIDVLLRQTRARR